jgi:FkbM family methyltransferase
MGLTSFVPYVRQKSCRYGEMLFNLHDMYVGRSLDLYGEFSEGEVDVFRQVVQPGQTVLDIGANIGCHSLFLARQVGPGGSVLAFEPQRLVFQMLCANLALNSIPNVFCYQAAAGTQPGQLLVPLADFYHENNLGGMGLGGHGFGEPVPVLTIDGLNLPACHLIKIDVEGMEEQVLRGAVQTLSRFKPILYVENDREDKSASLIRYLATLDYAMYWHCPPLYNRDNYAGNPQNVFGSIVSKNMLCVHRSIPTKIAGIPEVQVPPAQTSPL